MSANIEILIKVLRAFDKEGLLDDLVLIGSWTHVFYSEHFGGPPEIPGTRTFDLDFLISRPKRIKKEVDVPAILKGLDFRENVDPTDKVVKYLHPDLELELLAPLVGPQDKRPVAVPKLRMSAQRLRFLDVLCENVLTVRYKGMKVLVPQPAAYVLQKLLIQDRRKPGKKAKDMEAMQGISRFLLKSKEGKAAFLGIFAGLPAGWRKAALAACEKDIPALYAILESA